MIDKQITKQFTHRDRAEMGRALDEQSVFERRIKAGLKDGSMTPDGADAARAAFDAGRTGRAGLSEKQRATVAPAMVGRTMPLAGSWAFHRPIKLSRSGSRSCPPSSAPARCQSARRIIGAFSAVRPALTGSRNLKQKLLTTSRLAWRFDDVE